MDLVPTPEDKGITVVEKRLHNCFGFYDAETHTICIDCRLSPPAKRTTIMHEVIHAERGDYAITDNPHTDAKQEYEVEREVAFRLISIRDLEDGLKWCTSDQELAEYLNVDLSTLQVRFETLSEVERALLKDVWR